MTPKPSPSQPTFCPHLWRRDVATRRLTFARDITRLHSANAIIFRPLRSAGNGWKAAARGGPGSGAAPLAVWCLPAPICNGRWCFLKALAPQAAALKQLAQGQTMAWQSSKIAWVVSRHGSLDVVRLPALVAGGEVLSCSCRAHVQCAGLSNSSSCLTACCFLQR